MIDQSTLFCLITTPISRILNIQYQDIIESKDSNYTSQNISLGLRTNVIEYSMIIPMKKIFYSKKKRYDR
jgi:hypothetical protein